MTPEPIRDKSDIKKIKALLKNMPRNYCLFALGINTDMPPSKLVRLKIKDISALNIPDDLKDNLIRLAGRRPKNQPLFLSQRGKSLEVQTVRTLVKKWCGNAGIEGNFSALSLKKTYLYHKNIMKLSL